MNEMAFAFSPGRNHLRHLSQVVDSIRKFHSEKYSLKFLLLVEDVDWIIDVPSDVDFDVRALSLEDKEMLSDLYCQEGRVDISPFPAYSQLLIPKYFSDYSHFLFLEVDQIVIGDLYSFWTYLKSNIKLGAVRWKSRFDYLSTEPFRRLHPKGAYYNTGVVFVDVNFWNRNLLAEKCFDEIRLQKECKDRLQYYAEGAINNALQLYVSEISWRLNFTGLGYEDGKSFHELRSALILHWNGSKKPWTTDGLYKDIYINLGFVDDECNLSKLYYQLTNNLVWNYILPFKRWVWNLFRI